MKFSNILSELNTILDRSS